MVNTYLYAKRMRIYTALVNISDLQKVSLNRKQKEPFPLKETVLHP